MKDLLHQIHEAAVELEYNNKIVEAKVVNDIFLKIALEQSDLDEIAQQGGHSLTKLNDMGYDPDASGETHQVQNIFDSLQLGEQPGIQQARHPAELTTEALQSIAPLKNILDRYDCGELFEHFKAMHALIKKAADNGGQLPGINQLFAFNLRPIIEDLDQISKQMYDRNEISEVHNVIAKLHRYLNEISHPERGQN